MNQKLTKARAFLTTLYFSKPLTSKDCYYILNDLKKVTSTNFLGQLKSVGYLTLKDGYYKLSTKGKSMITSNLFSLELNRKKGHQNSLHENMTLRIIYNFLLETNQSEILEIIKEKNFNKIIEPDIFISTTNLNLVIEIDTGTERHNILDSKIQRYNTILNKDKDKLIFVSSSKRNRDHLLKYDNILTVDIDNLLSIKNIILSSINSCMVSENIVRVNSYVPSTAANGTAGGENNQNNDQKDTTNSDLIDFLTRINE
jgi:hypothetical protein